MKLRNNNVLVFGGTSGIGKAIAEKLIASGATLTPMISSYAKSESDKYARHAIERFIKPEEIAELAFYLLSDYGEIICGHTVVADEAIMPLLGKSIQNLARIIEIVLYEDLKILRFQVFLRLWGFLHSWCFFHIEIPSLLTNELK